MQPLSRKRHLLHHLKVRLRQLAVVFVVTASLKLPWLTYVGLPVRQEISSEADSSDVLARRAYIVQRVTAPDFSPALMPALLDQTFQEEWAIGTLSMTSLALTNLAFEYPKTQPEAQRISKNLIERMLQPDIRIFENRYWGEDSLETLESANGHIGYLGHLNLMLGSFRILGGGCDFEKLHRQITRALVRRMKESPSHFLETFPGQIFVPDNMVAAASVAISGIINEQEQPDVLRRFVGYARNYLLDPQTQVLVPWVSKEGQPLGIPRGSYAAWNSFFLPMVDEEFAHQQFTTLRQYFLVRPLPGFAALREYPPGRNGPADIDSGPVVFGLSTSGTGFMLAGARRESDAPTYYSLLRTAELVGSSIEIQGKRRYSIAPLIGDSIVLAMRSAQKWDTRFLKHEKCGSP